MKYVKEYISSVLLLCILIYGGVVGYWLFYPYDVIAVECPLKVLNADKIIKRGDRLSYMVKWEKKLPFNGVLSRKLVNSFTFNYTDVQALAPVGEDETMVSVLIPAFVPVGEYYLLWTVTYKVNPVREVVVQAKSESFMVVNGEDKKTEAFSGCNK